MFLYCVPPPYKICPIIFENPVYDKSYLTPINIYGRLCETKMYLLKNFLMLRQISLENTLP